MKYDQLTTNFNAHEFRCRGYECCDASAPINPALVRALQSLRDMVGVPLKVNSGFRCYAHNRTVGSNDESQHPKGLAADIALPEGVDIETMRDYALTLGEFRDGGIGLYDTFIHLDIRGTAARWDKRGT